MNNWEKVLVGPESTISSVIKIIDQDAAKVAIVVDNSRKLLGTVTDGDIRRAIIRKFSLETRIENIMQSQPKACHLKDSKSDILGKMKRFGLLQMPLLNDDGQVCGLETLGSLSEKPSFDNPVFLMAGGFGKRLHPLTLQTPKPLLKVGNKPILEMILESFIEAGFHNFYISTFYEAEQLKNHFGDGDKWNVSINYIDENHPLGTAGSLGLLPPDLPDHPLIMMNGDLLTRVDYAKLLQYHDESKGDATICVREYDFQVPFGVVKGNGIKVEEIQEKPIYSFFVNAGIYVLEPDFYKNLGNADYLDMPDLLQHRLADGAVINMYPIHEYWLDIGRMEDFKQANLDASLFR